MEDDLIKKIEEIKNRKYTRKELKKEIERVNNIIKEIEHFKDYFIPSNRF